MTDKELEQVRQICQRIIDTLDAPDLFADGALSVAQRHCARLIALYRAICILVDVAKMPTSVQEQCAKIAERLHDKHGYRTTMGDA